MVSFEQLPPAVLPWLGYFLGAVAASFAQLQSGQPLLNVTRSREPINRMTKSLWSKLSALTLAIMLGNVPFFWAHFPDPSFKTSLAAGLFIIPYVHSGSWTGLIRNTGA